MEYEPPTIWESLNPFTSGAKMVFFLAILVTSVSWLLVPNKDEDSIRHMLVFFGLFAGIYLLFAVSSAHTDRADDQKKTVKIRKK